MTSQAPTTPTDAGLVAAAADEDHEASLARRTVSGLAWTISMGWGARIVQLFGTLLLTYFVDPEAMGQVTNAAVLVMTADRLSGLGVSNYLLTMRNPSREVAWHVTLGLAASGIVAMAALMLFAGPMSGLLRSPDLLSYLPGLILSTLLTRVGVVPERLLQGRLRFRDVSVSRAWSEMSYTLAATAMGVAGAGGMAVVGGNLCRSAVYVLLMAQRVPPEQ